MGSGAGGIYNGGSITIINSTFYGNRGRNHPLFCGGGLLNGSSATIINSIFWGNKIVTWGEGIYQQIMNSSWGSPTITVSYSDIQGGYPGEGNMETDPLFAASGYWDDNGTPTNLYDDIWVNGDYHLKPASPCIDTGTENVPLLPNTDFEGDPRIIGPFPDMGADEFVKHLTIDIYPGTYPNVINLKAKGVVPVAILSDQYFKASAVDPESVLFASAKPAKWSTRDVNFDGIEDMVLHFRIQELHLNTSISELNLSGVTKGEGIYLLGKDPVKVID